MSRKKLIGKKINKKIRDCLIPEYKNTSILLMLSMHIGIMMYCIQEKYTKNLIYFQIYLVLHKAYPQSNYFGQCLK